MKLHLSLKLIAASSIYLSTLPISAQDKPPILEKKKNDTQEKSTKPKHIHIYSEITEISSIQYAELMTAPMMTTNQTTLRNKLIEQVKKGDAKLISNHSIMGRSGEKFTTESIQEITYETEYEPGESIPSKDKEGKKSLNMILPPTPTAFETRNVGTLLEVEPTLSDTPEIIHINFSPEIVKHTGYNLISTWDTELAKVKLQMPNFSTNRIKTSFTVYNNQFTLVGTYAPDLDGVTDESRKLLHFVKASVVKVAQ